MASIAPFRGVTYNYYERQDLSNLVAPPYDVISEEEQERYHQADPHNVIHLILGRKKTGDSDWDNRYTRAADSFKRWQSDGTLIRADQPCIYVTSLTYDPGEGRPRQTRWGIIAVVRIEDPASGIILPHEKTFSAHKDDRLRLMRACDAQFSQIFGLYEDPNNTILNTCKKAINFSSQIAFDLDNDTNHRMWILQSPPLFKKVADALAGKTIFIADGHHRYETARNYRDIMRARRGRRPVNRSFEYVTMYLSNMYDEGLTILPSHRLIKDVPHFHSDRFLETVGKWFNIEEFPFPPGDITTGCAALKQRLETAGSNRTAIAFYQGDPGLCRLLSLKPGVKDEMGSDLHSSIKKLDVLILSRFLVQRGLGFSREHLDNDEIFHYESSMKKAVQQVQSGDYQMTFLLNPTKIDQIKEIANNSLVMPRKSTYFYPKVLTGLVFNKLDPHEIMQTP